MRGSMKWPVTCHVHVAELKENNSASLDHTLKYSGSRANILAILGVFGARPQLQRAKDTFWKLSLRGLVNEIIHCNFSISIMAIAEGDQLLKQITGRNTRGLLRLIILCTIA